MQEPWKEDFQKMNEPVQPSAELLQVTRQRMGAARPQKWLFRLQKTLAVAACTALLFVGAVNLSPAFASAAARVPILRELTAAVSLDPSMKAAIEHRYVQLVKQSDSDKDFRLEVEYLVADKANLTVYFRLLGMGEEETAQQSYSYHPVLLDQNGRELEGYGASWGAWVERENGLRTMQFHFTAGTLPEQIQLQLTVEKKIEDEDTEQRTEAEERVYGIEGLIASYEEPQPEYEKVATLTVPLTIDRGSLFNVREIDLQQTVEIAGQKIILEKAEIYPTQMRVYWQEAAENEAYITDLRMSLQGRRHHRWEKISNGVSGIGMTGERRQTWLDSSWFSDDGVYLLQIDEASLLPKKNRQVTYDYRSNTFTGLPAYIRLKNATPCDTGLFMEFEMKSSGETVYGSVFSGYTDSNGQEQIWEQAGSGRSYDRESEEGVFYFYNQFIAKNYENGPITFTLNWAPPQKLEDPILIPLEEAKVVPIEERE